MYCTQATLCPATFLSGVLITFVAVKGELNLQKQLLHLMVNIIYTYIALPRRLPAYLLTCISSC